MAVKKYEPLGGERSIEIGKTMFLVNSYADSSATETAEEIIMKMLRSKIKETIREEKSA